MSTRIEVPIGLLDDIIDTARDCADELEAELDARYPLRHEQAIQERRWNRDMEAVFLLNRSIKALQKWRESAQGQEKESGT